MKKKIKKVEKIEVPIVEAPSTTGQKLKIASFSGEFGRQDINLLRDKVNEIVNFLNEQ